MESSKGDYLLSPAYDLINTRLHVDDTDFALNKGLFADDFKSTVFQKNNHSGKSDFIEFGQRLGIKENRINLLLAPFLEKQKLVEKLISHSFLDDSSKRGSI